MDEVSGRFAKWVFESGIRDGVSQPKLLHGTKVAAEVLAAGRARIDWDDYVQMLENYHAEVGLEGMKESAHAFGTSMEVASFGRMAGLFFSPRRLYSYMYRWVGNHFLRNVRFELVEEEDGKLKITSEIDAGSRGSEVYFLTLINVLAGTPLRIGREPAEVEITSLSDHRAEYRVSLSGRPSGIGWALGWPLRFARSLGTGKEILVRQQDEIREGQSAIDRQQREFASMIDSLSDPLFIIGSEGETLFVNRTARRRFLVPNPPGEWRPEDALEAGGAAAWLAFIEAGAVAGEEFPFLRKDLGGVTAQLLFRSAQDVAFAGKEARLLVGRDVTARRRLEVQMREVAFEERSHLAAEIHDGLGQQLTGISLRSDALSKELAGANPEKAGQAADIAAVARKAIAQARDLAHGLAAIDERADNLRRGLVGHADKLRRQCGLEVLLDLPVAEPLTAPGQRALELLRIVQEACHNAVKHSGGTQIAICLEVGAETWTLSVADDGGGMPGEGVARSSGMGMASMAYRASQLGGTLTVGARRDGKAGAEVVLKLQSGQDQPAAEAAAQLRSGVIRLLIADDQRVVLDGLVARLGLEPDFQICAQVSARGEIVPSALETEPDVIVLDMLMGAEDNLGVIGKLRQHLPTVGIVVVSMFDTEYYEQASLEAGADAYVMKQSASDALVRVIREVAGADRG